MPPSHPHDADAPASPASAAEALLEELSEAIAVVDGEWRLVRVNRAAEWLLGSERAELLGRVAWGLFGFPEGTPAEASLRRAMAERRRTLFEVQDPASGRWGQVQAWPVPAGLALRLSDVTERHEAESALRASEERYRLLVERSPEAIAVHRDSVLLYVNRAAAALAAVDDPHSLAGTPVTELFHPDDHPRLRRRAEDFEDSGRRETDATEARLLRRDGRTIEVEIVSVPVVYAGRAAVQSVVRDVTERRQAERALREGGARLRDAERRARATAERMRAVASAAAGVMAADSLEALHRVLRGACAAALPFELFTFALYDAAHHALVVQTDPDVGIPPVTTFVSGTPAERVVRGRRSLLTVTGDDPAAGAPDVREGRRPASVIRTPVLAGDEVLGVVSVHSYTPGLYGQQDVEVLEVVAALASTAVRNIRLVEAIRRSEERLAHQAFHDPLTDLANRALFLDRVRHALARRQRSDAGVAVLFVDLDDFKKVNDSLGHATGDRLLVAAAERLCGCVRSADTVARLGGDEFAVLVEDAGGPTDAALVAERLVDALRAPFGVGSTELFVSASVGVAIAAPGESADDLLRNADVAMYYAKARRKDGHAVFEPWMHEAVRERLAIEADLRRALERNELSLHYQPIVRLDTGIPIGVEALVRWQHPDRGAVSPGAFIPVAEDTGLIVSLGRWILREACEQARRWQSARAGVAPPLRVTINISGRQLQDASFVADVRETLAATGVDATSLVLEITESVLMQHTEVVLERLRELKALGLSLAIDDFGTGYSSLGYLQRFPIDILKIDKAFVDAVRDGDGDPALARAVIALGDSLGMQTVAEGIEGAAQADGLRRLGCQLGQGYHFARPLPAEALSALLGVQMERAVA
ncbi:MAG TPA: EAL domain-containing protein [Gemmatimonadaceae bacterium]|nr:EAL domain-containing protein [Gemmatimonadaceae bacterium]